MKICESRSILLAYFALATTFSCISPMADTDESEDELDYSENRGVDSVPSVAAERAATDASTRSNDANAQSKVAPHVKSLALGSAGAADPGSPASPPEAVPPERVSSGTLELNFDGQEVSAVVHLPLGDTPQRGDLLGSDDVAAAVLDTSFEPNNVLNLTAQFKNLSDDTSIRNIVFKRNPQTSPTVGATMPSVQPCLDWEPQQHNGPYTFSVQHKGEPFRFFIDIYADENDGSICGVEANVSSSPSAFRIDPGQKRTFATSLNFTTLRTEDFQIAVSQTVRALSGPQNGIALTPAIPGGFSSAHNYATVYPQEITALAAGTYEVETTAEVIETGELSTAVSVVTVGPPPVRAALANLRFLPAALPPEDDTLVLFTVRVSGYEMADPPVVETTGDVEIALRDDGTNGDLAANDGAFSAAAVIDTGDMAPGDCLSVGAEVTTGTTTLASATSELCVTTLPVELEPTELEDTEDVIEEPISGVLFVANEILVRTYPGTVDSDIEEIANNIGGEIVGTIPALHVVQVRLSLPVGDVDALDSILDTVRGFPTVNSAEGNAVVIGFSGPNDPRVQPPDLGGPNATTTRSIRAHETWAIAQGGVTVAIVDSGIDPYHPDFYPEGATPAQRIPGNSPQFLKNAGTVVWRNYMTDGSPSSNDPVDPHGHGTHVAGIVGAVANNNTGVAGIAPQSPLLVVRALRDDLGELAGPNAVLGTSGSIASGIVDAATLGAAIINVSSGTAALSCSNSATCAICAAVNTVYNNGNGALVVAAAGTLASPNVPEPPVYPAACPNAIAVTSVTEFDVVADLAPRGSSWVSLAAPGEDVMSTLPYQTTCTVCSTTNGYGTMSGSSMAAAMVSGSLAALQSHGYTPADALTRLQATAIDVVGVEHGRIDLFEALFNGDFELDFDPNDMVGWEAEGTAGTLPNRGPIQSQHGGNMAFVNTGPGGDHEFGEISQAFTVQDGVTQLELSFRYTFVTEEYPEWVNTIYDDRLEIFLETPSGTVLPLASENVNNSYFEEIPPLPNGNPAIVYQGGDETIGWTCWKTVNIVVPVTAGAQGDYRIFLTDEGDHIYDSEVLVDDLRFECQGDCSSTPPRNCTL